MADKLRMARCRRGDLRSDGLAVFCGYTNLLVLSEEPGKEINRG